MSKTICVPSRFTGPPNFANGGYVAGVMAKKIGNERRFDFKAPIPLETKLTLVEVAGAALLSTNDRTCVEAMAPALLPNWRSVPNLSAVLAAEANAIPSCHGRCVCCSQSLPPGEGLAIAVGSLEPGSAEGCVAGTWTPDASFANRHGLVDDEIVWAALDCPGFYAWAAVEGTHFAVTASLAAEVLRVPEVGEECIILAYTGERVTERRRLASVLLYSADGEPMARMAQSWVRMSRTQRTFPG